MTSDRTFDLHDTYAHLDGEAVTVVEGGDAFWQRVATTDPAVDRVVGGGWMVMTFHNAATWSSWEVHPDGDEIVHLLDGRLDLLLELPEGVARVPVRAGQTVVVPKGVWHTAEVHEPGDTLHITFGRGTQNRPA